MALLSFKVDDETLRPFVVALDLAKAPALVYDIGARSHAFQLGFGRFERRVFGYEREDGFGIHGCVMMSLKRQVERIMRSLVKLCINKVPNE